VVQPYCDSPIDQINPAGGLYLQMISRATRYIYIETPYLIIDNETVTALRNAALAGVDVRIVTPHHPDKWYVHRTTRSFYARLIEAGVGIYEYTPGFIHSKIFLRDDEAAVVGTVNLDFRSLYLHYECAAYLADTPAIADIKQDFLENIMPVCTKITMEQCVDKNPFSRLLTNMLTLFAPLM